MEYIEIEGGEARMITKTIIRSVKTEDMVKILKSSASQSTGLLPEGCISMETWKKNGADSRIYVIQQEPRIVNMKYRPNAFNACCETVTAQCAWPWVQWYIHVVEGVVLKAHVSFSSKPVTGPDSEVFTAPLPNQLASSGFCQGDVVSSDLPLPAQISRYIGDLICSVWNDDHTPPWEIFDLLEEPDGFEPTEEREGEEFSFFGDFAPWVNDETDERCDATRRRRSSLVREQEELDRGEDDYEERKQDLTDEIDDLAEEIKNLSAETIRKHLDLYGIMKWGRETESRGLSFGKELCCAGRRWFGDRVSELIILNGGGGQ